MAKSLEAVVKRLDALEVSASSPPAATTTTVPESQQQQQHSLLSLPPPPSLSSAPVSSVADKTSWAATAISGNVSALTSASKTSIKPWRGSNSSVKCTIKTVPRPLACFVGRLDINTTEEGLHQYLDAQGFKGVVCRKLESKNGRTFKSAAFKVTCPQESYDLFYDERCWPDGAELRDWVYLPLKMASIVSGSLCKFVSYNLHGLNSGRSFLTDLCCDDNVAVIAVQEHWLSNSNLHLLNSIHSDFLSIGISAMTKRLSKEIYLGRPYGGVAFLFRRHFANKISVVASDDNGRCLVISLKINDTLTVKLVNVYFPCADGSVSYKVELGNCLGLIENAVSAEDKCIVLGDMNFECVDNNVGFKICRPVFEQLGLCNCDHLCTSQDRITYTNTALMASSFIEYIFVSDCLLTDCSNIDIIDSGCKLVTIAR